MFSLHSRKLTCSETLFSWRSPFEGPDLTSSVNRVQPGKPLGASAVTHNDRASCHFSSQRIFRECSCCTPSFVDSSLFGRQPSPVYLKECLNVSCYAYSKLFLKKIFWLTLLWFHVSLAQVYSMLFALFGHGYGLVKEITLLPAGSHTCFLKNICYNTARTSLDSQRTFTLCFQHHIYIKSMLSVNIFLFWLLLLIS